MHSIYDSGHQQINSNFSLTLIREWEGFEEYMLSTSNWDQQLLVFLAYIRQAYAKGVEQIGFHIYQSSYGKCFFSVQLGPYGGISLLQIVQREALTKAFSLIAQNKIAGKYSLAVQRGRDSFPSSKPSLIALLLDWSSFAGLAMTDSSYYLN